ncbi:MAG: DUF4340 domain-containing protein [Opitutaceae bacterium]|nr:DUF4340 domain-containing protein [Opitutaceae bacterium]
MRTKVTLALLFLNAVLFFFIFKFERPSRLKQLAEETQRRVLGPEAADIRSLEITGAAPGAAFALERRRDTWFLTQPHEWPANLHAAKAIVHDLQLLEHESAFAVADLPKSGLSLADYGLDKPRLSVAFSSVDPGPGTPRTTTTLRLGDVTKDGKRLYVLSPDGQRVHVVKRSLADSLAAPLEQLRADSLLNVRAFEARSLSIQTTGGASNQTPGSAGVRVRIRRDGTRWRFETPLVAAANRLAVETTIGELNALRAKSFPATPPATLPSAAPVFRISLEGNGVNETLFVGEPAAAAAPGGKPAAMTEHFAQLEGRTAVFTIALPADLHRVLTTAQETLREKRVLDFEPAQVTAIALASPAQPRQPPITLQRLEPAAGQAPDAPPSWQIVARADGTQGPQTVPAERALVARLLDVLSVLSAEKFQSDNPTSADLEEWGFNRPVREVTLTLSGTAAPIVLRLGTDANRTLMFARPGTPGDPGTSVYQVRADIERDLDLSPLAWRDRAVAEPLPAAARIAAVKLTEIESKRTVFEAAFDAAGQPQPAPANAAALATMVAALRAPRAKEFAAGGFADRITAAGAERPWHLLLDYSIALPGAAGTEVTSQRTLHLTERLGGGVQFAGDKDRDLVFALEQPFIDALWALTYGPRDPGPRVEQKK